MFLDMVGLIGGGEHFTLIDKIHFQRFQDLGLGEMPNTAFSHDRYGDRRLNLLYHAGVRHAGHPAIPADVGRNPFQCHNSHGSRLLRYLGLLHGGDVHNHTAFEHLSQADFDFK